MLQTLIYIHLLAATIWVGGHAILSIGFLPKALKNKDPEIIRNFEKSYEPIGLPSLLLLVITGVWIAYEYGTPWQQWFHFSTAIEKIISLKLMLLLSTVMFAVHARFFIIPQLTAENLGKMAVHIVAVTLIGLAMFTLGTLVRFGGL